MSEQKQQEISGKILKLKEVKRTDSNYVNYNVSFSDGSVYPITNKAIRGKDQEGKDIYLLNPRQPEVGEEVTAKLGTFDKYYFEWGQEDAPKKTWTQPVKAQTKGEDAPAEKPAYVKPANKEDYFRDKAHYDEHVRDPKIEFQCYWTIIGNAYAAAIPTLEEPPKNVQEVDAYIDQAFDKAKAIYLKVNDKKKA